MRDALRATGRPIVYSINPGNGSGCPPTGPTTSRCGLNLPSIANLWRIGFDINASWSSITGLIDQDAPLSPYAGPGHWNDPDMLEVGNGAPDRGRGQVALQHVGDAGRAAPRRKRPSVDVRGHHDDPRRTPRSSRSTRIRWAIKGTLVATPQSGLQVWSKTLGGNNARAVALLNRNGSAASIIGEFTAHRIVQRIGIRA